jgi:hypothetical protein
MTSNKNVIKKLFDLEDNLQAAIEEHESDIVRAALVHVQEGIKHLHDTLTAEESMQR